LTADEESVLRDLAALDAVSAIQWGSANNDTDIMTRVPDARPAVASRAGSTRPWQLRQTPNGRARTRPELVNSPQRSDAGQPVTL
jgi:hypothetical protein